MTVIIPFKKLSDQATAPYLAKRSDCGRNLFCIENFTLEPGERHLFKTNIACEIPSGFYGRIAPRSGLAYKQGIHTLGGVVDSNYRGDIGVILVNLGQESYEVKKGDKIAQFIITPYLVATMNEVEELSESEREEDGFGSTGR